MANEGSSSSSSSASTSQAQSSGGPANGSNGSDGTLLDSIDAVCSAIHSIAVSGGDAGAQYKLVRESLFPALSALEAKGTAARVPGHMILQSALQGGADPLVVLMQNPQATGNGLGYLYILIARCHAENADPRVMVSHIINFCAVADTHQLRLVPQKVQMLALWLAWFCQSNPGEALQPLGNLLGHYTADASQFLTSLHPIILLQSLRAVDYGMADQLLNRYPISEIDTKNFPITYQDNLKYHLYGGTIQAVIENYPQAIDLLETAVSAPAHAGAISLLQVDAYKRLILVQLLQNGKTSPLPKYVSSNLTQHFKQHHTTPYLDFAKLYETLDRSKLHSFINEHRRTFENDANWGLVERLINAIPARSIMDLQKIYKTIELEELVKVVGIYSSSPSEKKMELFSDMNQAKDYAVKTIQRLVAQKKLSATISSNPEDPTKIHIEFLSKSALSSSQGHTQATLNQALRMLTSTSADLSYLDSRISSSRDFLSKAFAAAGKSSAAGSGVGAAGGFGGFEGMEEDLMAGGEGVWDE